MNLVSNAELSGLAPEEHALFESTLTVDRQNIARAIMATRPALAVVDTAVIPNLELLPNPLALILRETIPSRLPAFRLPGGRLWDEAIVAAPASEWRVTGTHIGARAVTNVGWIYRTAASAGGLLGRDIGRRTLLIATGGGGTEESASELVRELAPLIDLVRTELTADVVRILQVAGPRAPRCGLLPNVDAVLDVGSRLDEAFAEADLIISTAGYNSVLELATCNTPALLIAIARTYDDQVARAGLWGPRIGLDHRLGNLQRSANWIVESLMSGRRRNAVDLGPSGCKAAAARLAALLEGAAMADSRRHFIKRQTAGRPPPDVTAQRAQSLFAEQVPTCPGVATLGLDAVAFAKLKGPTAFEVWNAMRRDGVDVDSRASAVFFASIAHPLAKLHNANAADLLVPRLDAQRRITPRLSKAGSAAPPGAPALAGVLSDLVSTSARHLRSVLVHGDFHLRQLIRPTDRNDYVLVDLDDLAIGPAESDLGNCIAHLTTSEDADSTGIEVTIRGLIPRFVSGYRETSPVHLDYNAIRLFAALALVRRALKFTERGCEPDRVAAIIGSAAALADLPHPLGLDACSSSPIATVSMKEIATP